MDMDLDDLDGPSQAPSRLTRFAPKNSKFKPKPKSEQPRSQSQGSESNYILLPTKEEVPDAELPSLDSNRIDKVKNEPEFPSADANGNGVVEMDTELKPEGDEPKEDLMEEDEHEVEEEDYVVREIDVFFTPSVDSNTQLYVLQYPLRQCWRPYELDDRCEQVRVKPATSEIEIELSVDVDSKNYDPDADNGVRMTKQILSSSWKPPHRSGYAVGVLLGNKLHLNPVHAVVQLRPSMQHFRSGGAEKKHIASHVDDVVKEEKSVGSSRKQVKQPVNNVPCEDSGESWVVLNYHGAKSVASDKYLHKMVAEEGSHIQFFMNSSDYVNSMCPATSNIGPRGPSRRFLLSLPLEDRIKTWLLEGPPVHRFDALKHLAQSDSVENVLGVLQKLAYLVQGLWVPRSSLLYPQGLDALVRDYTLYLFSKSHLIKHKEIPQKRDIIKTTMKNILKVFAVERPSFNDWKFKEPKDVSFVKLHPDIVKEQEQAWESRGENAITEIYGERSRPGMKNPPKSNTINRVVPPKEPNNKVVPKTSTRAPAKASISDETREALLKTLQKLFQTHKVCSFQRICQLLRDMATSEANRPKGVREIISAARGLEAPPEELRAIINQVALDIHGVFVSKSSPDHSFNDLRKIVIDLLIVEGPNAKLKKAAIIEAGKIKLKREEIPTAEYNKVMNELCMSRGSVWVLKNGDGSPN